MENDNREKIASIMDEYQDDRWGVEQNTISNILRDDYEVNAEEINDICNSIRERKGDNHVQSTGYFSLL